MEDVETKEKKLAWGEYPKGYLILTAAGRWMVIQTAEGREARAEGDPGAAFRSMLAYSGRYRTEHGKITIAVDIAWDEAWIGTEQIRYFKLDENDRLHIEAPPQPYTNYGGKVMRGILVWVREV
jgi:hypothetical protein